MLEPHATATQKTPNEYRLAVRIVCITLSWAENENNNVAASPMLRYTVNILFSTTIWKLNGVWDELNYEKRFFLIESNAFFKQKLFQ